MDVAASNDWAEVLKHAIRRELRNAADYESLAQVFQGRDQSLAALFVEMTASSRRHAFSLQRHYQKNFVSAPLKTQTAPSNTFAADIEG